jgi:outer membrane receptor protein involved in Fe transport
MKTWLLAATALAGGFALPSGAFAQTTNPPAPAATTTAAADAETDEGLLVVTGSRIARSTIDGSVPVTSLSATELTNNGAVSIGDRLSLLPQFRPTFTTQNAGRFIGTAGISTLDLRGQGTARTLVLQNGRRHVTSSPGAQTVDVNTIPVDLIERVDIVTGGNSAIYGSDAVAGVVNFILKRDYEGFGIRGQMGLSDRGDNAQKFVAAIAGKNFGDGRGNVVLALEYSNQDPLWFRERDEFAGAFSGRNQFQLTQDTAFPSAEPPGGDGRIDTTFTTGIKNIGISTGGAFTSVCPAATSTNAARVALNCGGVFNAARTSQFGNVFAFLPDGTLARNVVQQDFRPFGSGNAQGGLGSTLRETGQLQTGNTRYSANLAAHYEVSEGFRPFFEGKFVRTEAIQEGQPTFSSGALNPSFSINNPFLTTQARNLLVTSLAPGATTFTMQRFNVDFGGRGERHERNLYRGVVGVDGSFMDTWRYEVALNYGRVETYYETAGNVANARFTNAVNAVRNPAGQIVCAINADASTTNDDPACRPINVFGFGAPSPEALAYIGHTSSREQWSEQLNVTAFVSGDSARWFELPGGPVGFSVGGEYREEDAFSEFDSFTRGGNTFLNAIGTFDPPKLKVWDAYAEMRLPIVKDVTFLKELTLEGAVRASDYNVGDIGTVYAYNAGVIWSPFSDLRLRGSYARSVRAPTLSDLFAAQSQTFLNGLADPCGQQNINSDPNRRANCAAAGVPTTQVFNGITEPFTNRPTSGISGLSGGNPLLQEEQADSWTVGGILTPSFAPGLRISVDWYRIKLKNAINTLAAQTIINQCYDSPDGINNQFCAATFRNPNGTFRGQQNVLHAGQEVAFPTTGQSFLQGAFNYARQETEGIDFDVSYNTTFGADWRLGVRGVVSYLISRNVFTSLTEPNRLTQEKFTLGNPETNAQVNLTLGYKALDFQYNFRYVGKMTVATTWAAQNSEQGRPPTNLDAFPFVFYPDVTYSDIRITGNIKEGTRAYFGIDNLFNQLPPFDLLGTGAGDAIYTNSGRFLYVGVEFKF